MNKEFYKINLIGHRRYPECEVGTRKSIFALLKSFLQPRRGDTAALVYPSVLSSRAVNTINNNRYCNDIHFEDVENLRNNITYDCAVGKLQVPYLRFSCTFYELRLSVSTNKLFRATRFRGDMNSAMSLPLTSSLWSLHSIDFALKTPQI
ncbi:hypothetical protein QTP88_017534 [Uroleucon formosanum]